MQVGINHLGHFLLTNLLLDRIKASCEGRIINLTSLAHRGNKHANNLNLKDFNSSEEYNPWTAFFYSKLANIYFTRQLATRLEAQGVTNVKTCSVHPGVISTTV
jgi:NAD(P)-dependent dehydrogenase (short-subunit alcohol dehydrogenase family)